jgi:hypothetical protein
MQRKRRPCPQRLNTPAAAMNVKYYKNELYFEIEIVGSDMSLL